VPPPRPSPLRGARLAAGHEASVRHAGAYARLPAGCLEPGSTSRCGPDALIRRESRPRGGAMQVPLTIADHLERAALVYPERIGVGDEPDQPLHSWRA